MLFGIPRIVGALTAIIALLLRIIRRVIRMLVVAT